MGTLEVEPDAGSQRREPA